MTDIHPERDVPQVDFDVHTGEPLGPDDTDSGRTHTDPAPETTDTEQEQS